MTPSTTGFARGFRIVRENGVVDSLLIDASRSTSEVTLPKGFGIARG